METKNLVVQSCTCASEYQDKKYGKNKRVMTKMNKNKTAKQCRCTVCGKEQNYT